MRFIAIAIAAAFLLAPGAIPSFAHHAKAYEHAPLAKAKKAKKAKKPKVEYMKAAPSR
jgi:hypothetical protein